MKKKLLAGLATGLLITGIATSASATQYADVAFVIDQTGSMGNEFSWISSSLSTIATSIGDAGITANYGVAGYETLAGSADSRNIWSDLGSDIAQVTAATSGASLYGWQERGYDAAQWSIDNFSWTGGNYAKVLILITDEYGDQGSSIGESALGQYATANNILLNVITSANLFSDWDDAVFTTPSGYQGLFDLATLQSDPTQFTADFTAAKINEITNHTPTPEPATMLLFGTGLAGLIGSRRRKKMQ